MGFGAASLFLKINFILLILAIVLQILGLALPYWVASDDVVDFNSGLFRSCIGDTCGNINNPRDWLEASRAFGIIGLLVLVGALVCTIIVIFVKNDMKVLKLVAWILAFVAAFCIMIEFAVYADKTDALSEYYSAGFALTILAFVVCLVCGVIGLIDWLGIVKGK